MIIRLLHCSCLVLAIPSHVVVSQSVFLTSTISTDEITCPGDEVTFTCETRGSSVIAWTSDDYIRDQLEFNAGDSFDETRQDSVDANTIATFINNTREEDGTRVLESQLKIVVSSTSLSPSVTCIQVRDNVQESFPFQVLGIYISVLQL